MESGNQKMVLEQLDIPMQNKNKKKLQFFFELDIKINSKCIIDLNVQCKNAKVLE